MAAHHGDAQPSQAPPTRPRGRLTAAASGPALTPAGSHPSTPADPGLARLLRQPSLTAGATCGRTAPLLVPRCDSAAARRSAPRRAAPDRPEGERDERPGWLALAKESRRRVLLLAR